MRVVIAANTSWNIYNFRQGLLERLAEKGNELYIVAPRDDYSDRLEKEFKVTCIHIPINGGGMNAVEDSFLVYRYYCILKRLAPHVVLSYTIKPNLYASLASRWLHIPVINNVSGLGSLFLRSGWVSRIARLLYKVCLHKAYWIFFQNHSDRELFQRLGVNPTGGNGVLPGSGVDLTKFNFSRESNAGTRFLFVGRLLKDKGVREYVEAANHIAEKHSHITFYIAGQAGFNNPTAVTAQELSQWIRSKQVVFLDYQDPISKVYEMADIMVLPSYREGLSRSLLEAAAMKMPLITTNVPGCRETVDCGENGLLCQPADAESLWKAMEKMLQKTEKQRMEMGRKSREKAEKQFDEQIVVDQYMKVIERIEEDNRKV